MPTAAARTEAKNAKPTSSGRRKTADSRSRLKDAVAMLKADHRAVEKLFGQYEKAKDAQEKLRIFNRIDMELKVHTQIEEEIFYPASREFLDDDDIVNEAIVEHQAAKDLMAQIEQMDPSDEMYDAKVTVLKEMIEHHVEEEEQEYFPEVRKSEMDTRAVGEQLKARREELMAQMRTTP
ncbi:hemerythrin domain-containing protein [Phenylobacterium sp.]|uniref:hemerythrin domain-containing protein n=1 Tax=Phenylobacterium sp. TaxID=1871053 RepID=UPI0039194803